MAEIQANSECYAYKILKNLQKEIQLHHYEHKLILGKCNILYININSIQNKLDDLEINIQNITQKYTNQVIHIIALTEIRIHEHLTQYFNIPHYASYFQTRPDGHGGCALFIHNSISSNLIEKKSFQNIEFITLALIELNASITVVYKQPTVEANLFIEIFKTLIENKRNMIIVGDFNINILKDLNSTRRFIDTVVANGYVILNKVTETAATRVAHRTHSNARTITTRTIIDLFITDRVDFDYKLSQMETPLSDHNEMLLSVDNKKANSFVTIESQISIQKINYNEYNNALHNFLSDTRIDSFNDLISGLKECVNNNTQNLLISRKLNPDKPWITEKILNLINERKRYFLLLNKSPANEYLSNKYNELCEQIKKERYVQRTNYNSSAINNNLNNPKQMWKKLNEIIFNKKNTAKPVPILNQMNNVSTTNRTLIANELNNYFKDVGKELHDRIVHSTNNAVPPEPICPNTIWLHNTTPTEVHKKIISLKTSKSLKEYFSSYSCKKHAHLIAPIISELINDCFTNGTFPQELKCSRIIPIFKDGSRLLANNYRPISILPVLSKIFESIICDRFTDFLTLNKIIHPNQFGFQKKSSTLSAAATLIDDIQRNLDYTRNNKACCVFIDLRKAFDTVPHTQLLEKLENNGIRGNANELIREYLSNRRQYVDIEDTVSETITNSNRFSLPQGSNLGPLLFLIYINGIFTLKLNGKLILFADDAVVVYFETDLTKLNEKIQEDLNAISNWLIANKLTLNTEKTNYMLIKPGSPVPTNINFSLIIGNKTLNRVTSFKYLGITIQENLKWNAHIDSISRKVIGFSSVMKRLGNQINHNTKISVYYSMIHSHYSYLSPIWGTTANANDISSLQIAQNEAIRKIFAYEYLRENISTENIRKKYEILNVRQLIKYNNVLMIHKIQNDEMKSNYRVNNSSIHRYPTSANTRPRFVIARTNIGQKSIYKTCTEQYHEHVSRLTFIPPTYTFKKRLKEQLQSEMLSYHT